MNVTSFHIELTNICTLKCSGCARTIFMKQWPQHWKNQSLDVQQLMQFLDIDLTGMVIELCGNYGDPIYHPRFHDMVSAFKERGALVSITTNGSYQKSSWWEELCSNLTVDDQVRFSIDGIPNNFTQYRENADWESIQTGIEVCVRHGIKTVWKFIPFEFNHAYIDQARQLSQDLGMTEFLLDPSDRFDEHTQHLKPINPLISDRNFIKTQVKTGESTAVNPACYSGQEYFITATGHFTPCCHVADHRFYYKTQFGKDHSAYNIRSTTFSKIFANSDVITFYKNIVSEPPLVCQLNCPATL